MSQIDPYATPSSTVDLHFEGTGPHRAPFEAGWQWFSSAFDLFRRDPGTWVGLGVILVLSGVAMFFLWFLQLAWTLLNPVIIGGLMIGAAEAAGRRRGEGEVEAGSPVFRACISNEGGLSIG